MSTKLIFLHGGPGYPDYLEPFFSGRFPEGVDTVFYSQSQKTPVVIDDLVEELRAKLTDETTNAFLIGHSWGGALAVEFLRRTRDPRIKGIVLIGSFLCAEDVTLEYRKELAELGLESPTTEQVFLAPHEYAAAGDLIARLKTSFNLTVFNQLWEGFVVKYDARDFVKFAPAPILNIFGEKDIRVPARRVRTYEELSHRIVNLEIPEAAHFPFILDRDREQVVRAIVNFVRENSV